MLRYLFLLIPVFFACAPSYNLKLEEVRPPLPADELVMISFGGQSIVGDVDTLGTLAVDTKNAAKCEPDELFGQALSIAKEAGDKAYHITAIDLEVKQTLIPSATFNRKSV